jgi:hypothetical protein
MAARANPGSGELVRRVRHEAGDPLMTAPGSVESLHGNPAVTVAAIRAPLEAAEGVPRRVAEIPRWLNAAGECVGDAEGV